MTCSEAQETLSEYLDGGLRGFQRVDAGAHFRDCEECRSALEGTKSLTAVLRDLPKVRAPEELAGSILQAFDGVLAQEAPRGPRVLGLPVSRLAPPAAAVLVLSIAATLYWRSTREEAPGPAWKWDGDDGAPQAGGPFPGAPPRPAGRLRGSPGAGRAASSGAPSAKSLPGEARPEPPSPPAAYVLAEVPRDALPVANLPAEPDEEATPLKSVGRPQAAPAVPELPLPGGGGTGDLISAALSEGEAAARAREKKDAEEKAKAEADRWWRPPEERTLTLFVADIPAARARVEEILKQKGFAFSVDGPDGFRFQTDREGFAEIEKLLGGIHQFIHVLHGDVAGLDDLQGGGGRRGEGSGEGGEGGAQGGDASGTGDPETPDDRVLVTLKFRPAVEKR